MTLSNISAPRPYFQGAVEQISPESARAILAAMKSVATHSGQRPLPDLAADMLAATCDHLFSSDIDLATLEALSPQQLAAQLPNQHQRQLAIQLLILMPYLPITIAPEAVAQVDAFAVELGVNPVNLKALHQVQEGHLGRLISGYSWRVLSFFAPQSGWWGKLRPIYTFFRQYYGDQQVARRYQALADYPQGSLGREYYQFCRDRNFPLPGEKGSFSELLVSHDLLHLLSGIGTDAAGEITAGGFEAGLCSNPEVGFELLLEVILDFHLGCEFTTLNLLEPTLGQFQPQAVMAAFVRGTQVRQDLIHPSWNFWAEMDQPLETLRQRYGLSGQPLQQQPERCAVAIAS